MRIPVRKLALAALVATTSHVVAAQAQDKEVVARASLQTADGKNAGVVNLVETPHGVLVTAALQNLPLGEHGFHIHETGVCEGDFASAGGHFAPKGNEHGFANEKGFHAGDMPNIFVGSDGTAEADFFNQAISLSGGENSIDDQDGSSIIVHADRDSYLQEAKAGERIACGVISFAE